MSNRPTVSSTGSDILVAGVVPLADAIAKVARDRPVFHSEADLQHSFGRVLWELAPEIRVRLEVRQLGHGRRYLDLLCVGPSRSTAIEFKYFTRAWTGTAGIPAEQYALRSHAATDLARRNFVFDIARLEQFCSSDDQDGVALLITNDARLWRQPPSGAARTRDHEFRIHEGRQLAGELRWADFERNARLLRGTYSLRWQDYSGPPSIDEEFRYLAVPIY